MQRVFIFLITMLITFTGFTQSTKGNTNVSDEKVKLQENRGITIDFTKSTGTIPKIIEDHFNKGVEKFDLKDYKGAIEEFTKAIELNDFKYAEAYYNRGVSKYKLEDYIGAIADYTIAIEVSPDYAKAYYNRGIAKSKSGQKESVCMDLKKAAELGYTKAIEEIKDYCK